MSYTKLDYIQSTEGQYIDTGIVSTSNIDYEIQYTVLGVGDELYQCVIGSDGYHNAFYPYCFDKGTGSTSGKCVAYCYDSVLWGYLSTDLQGVKTTLKKAKNVFNISADGFHQVLTHTSTATFSLSSTMRIFAMSDASPDYCTAKVHYCKIWDNGTLVCDFIPVKDESGIPCLYDTVSATYFYNHGSGSFVAGAEVSNGEEDNGEVDTTIQLGEYVPIKTKTLKSFGDQARRLGGVTGELTTAEMLDIFSQATSDSGYSFMPVMTGVNAYFDARHEVTETSWGNLSGEIDFELFNPTVTANGVELVGSETSYGKVTLPWTSGSSRTAYFVFKNLNGIFGSWKSIIGNEDTNGRCATIAMDASGYIKFTRYDITPSTSLGYKCSDWHVVAVVSSGSTVKLWIDGDYIGSANSSGWANDTYLCRGYGWAYETNETAFRAIAFADSAHTNAEIAINSGWLYHQFIYNYTP